MDDKRFMVTHSLLNSWSYALKENPYEDMTSERDPMADFLATLRREPIPTSEAMQNGIDFEDLVTAVLKGTADPGHRWYNAASEVATLIKGAQLQHKASRTVRIAGRDVFLYGRLDALKAGIIYDIKFTSSYDAGKYYDSTQHPMYLALVPEAYGFTYLVSNGTNVWPEHYRRDETPDILPAIQHFFAWLDNQGLTQVYLDNWEARG
jgi:hypothetical protein